MKVATWNVNSLKARLPRVLEFLDAHRPDVLCLQETKSTAAAFPHDALATAGYHAVDDSRGSWNGVALLAPQSLAFEDVVQGLPGDPAGDDARWIEATAGGVRIASVYVVNGRAVDHPLFEVKLAFLDAMARRCAAAVDAGQPMVVAGDFNIAPAGLDVWNPAAFAGSTHVTPAERSRLQAILDTGMVDALRCLHPDLVQHTWWDYRAGSFHRGWGLRIDLALVSRDLADRLRGCGIDRDFRKGKQPSDHAPLIVEWD